MKIIKVISSMFLLIILATACEEDKTLATVKVIDVSQGTYIGVVHITWEPVSGASNYNIERKGNNGEWISAGSVNEPPFDDYGFGLSDNKLVKGEKYVYRISSASDDSEDSPFSDPSGKGWIYELQPIELEAIRQEDNSIIVSWTDPVQTQINQINLLYCKYIVKRRYEGETSFTDLYTTSNISTVQSLNYTDENVSADKKAYYKIQGWYQYSYKNMDYGMGVEFWIEDFLEVMENESSTQPV